MRGKKKEARAEVMEVDSLQRPFELAHFILQDKASAIEVVTSALQKLRLQCRREKRRVYWRYKHPTQPIRRITRKDVDALQWLIMYESESHERRQEQLGSPSTRDMVVRYVKHIVSITTSMSSFYVSVGLNRLLYNYATSEVQAAYELVTNRFLGPDQYRRAKSILSSQVKSRFEGLLETTKGAHGEIRFSALQDQDRWAALVDDCLTILTPWSTDRVCSSFIPKVGGDETLQADTLPICLKEADPDAAEMYRCHVFIEPVCRRRLLAALAFPPPQTKLALPRFLMSNKTDEADRNGSADPRVSGLSQEEKNQIARRLAALDELRKGLRPHSLSIVVNGLERSPLDLTRRGDLRIELENGAKLIEIWGKDETKEVLLGIHLISYVNNSVEFSKAFLPIQGGRLEFVISPLGDSGHDARGLLTLVFKPRFQLIRGATPGWQLVRGFALTGLAAAAIAWAATTAIYTRKIRMLQRQIQQSVTSRPEKLGRESVVESFALRPDDQMSRSLENREFPKVSLHSQVAVVKLELPISERVAPTRYRAALRRFSGNHDLLVENGVLASQKGAGAAVTALVPADLLEPGVYYTVRLYSISANGHLQEINSFTFQVIENQ